MTWALVALFTIQFAAFLYRERQHADQVRRLIHAVVAKNPVDLAVLERAAAPAPKPARRDPEDEPDLIDAIGL